jgi:hypothetical protein
MVISEKNLDYHGNPIVLIDIRGPVREDTPRENEPDWQRKRVSVYRNTQS